MSKRGLPVRRAHVVARLLLDKDTYEHACRVGRWNTVALLHDVIEDTDCTLDDLKALGFGERTTKCVDALTRKPEQSYGDYIEAIRIHPIWMVQQVKIADLKDNLYGRPGPPSDSLRKRYEKALQILATGEWKEVEQ